MHLSVVLTVDGGFYDPDGTKKIFSFSVMFFFSLR